jgi:hypothetical protein
MHADTASTILVVEDDDATRTFLADNLMADGYGCDDYVGKQFSYPELRGRRLRGGPVELSQREFAPLRVLAAEPTRVCHEGRASADDLGVPVDGQQPCYRSITSGRLGSAARCALR